MDRYCRSFGESIYNTNGGSSNMNNSNNTQLRDPWSYDCSYFVGGESHSGSFLGGFSWPPRSYTCSFCKREFRSAQALGGHMNVHRRDRARLRESSPWDAPTSPNPNPNPNPNPDPEDNIEKPPVPNLNNIPEPASDGSFPPLCPPAEPVPQANPTLPRPLSPFTQTGTDPSPPFVSASPNLYSTSHEHYSIPTMTKSMKPVVGVGEMAGVDQGKGDLLLLRRKRDVVRLDLKIGIHGDHDLGEDLDLELRLGYG